MRNLRIDLTDAEWKRLKVLAAAESITLSALLAGLLREWAGKPERRAALRALTDEQEERAERAELQEAAG